MLRCRQFLVLQTIYVVITLLTYFSVGIDRSYLAFVFDQLRDPDSIIVLNETQKSWIASCTSILSPLGCLSCGVLMDYFGRKLGIQMTFVPLIIAWLLIGFAQNVMMLYAAGLIQGIHAGMVFCVATYISEISSSGRRGALLAILGINYNFGILLIYVSMYYFKWNTVAIAFSFLFGLCLLITIILPESPTWLYLKGRTEKSIKTLSLIRCQNVENIEFEIRDMEEHCKQKRTLKENLRACVNSWKPLAIVITAFILAQNTGYTILLLFIIMILEQLHIPYEGSNIALLYSIVGALTSIITPFFTYKFGRKTVIACSASGMATSMSVVLAYEYFYTESFEAYAWIVPVALCSFSLACGLGVLPMGFMLGGELFPNEIRGTLNGIYGTVSYIYLSLLYKIYSKYLSDYGVITSLCTFVIFSILLALFAIFVLPETKNKTLNQVQEEYFNKKKNKLKNTHQMT